jgi:hypothetical protein
MFETSTSSEFNSSSKSTEVRYLQDRMFYFGPRIEELNNLESWGLIGASSLDVIFVG